MVDCLPLVHQYLVMAPFISITFFTRRVIDSAKRTALAFGYAFVARVHFCLKAVNESFTFSSSRSFFSAHAHTFSCGFRSGLPLGHGPRRTIPKLEYT